MLLFVCCQTLLKNFTIFFEHLASCKATICLQVYEFCGVAMSTIATAGNVAAGLSDAEASNYR